MTDQVKQERSPAAAMAEHMVKLFTLWLTVGNGLGLAAAAGKLLDKPNSDTGYLLFPSIWSFAIGLLGGVLCATAQASMYWIDAARDGSNDVKVKQDLYRQRSGVENWLVVYVVIGGGGFVVGLFYPIVTLSIRYFVTGSLAN